MSEQKHAAEVLADKLDSDTQPTWVWVDGRGGYRNTGNVTRPLSAKAATMLRTIPALEAELMEQARIVGMGAERELALIAERDALRADFRRLNEKHTNLHLNADACRKEREALRAEVEALRAERDQATSAEREACAKVCNQIASSYNKDNASAFEDVADYCATSIRARGNA